MIKLELMQDLSEIVNYGQTGIPLSIRTANLSAYPGRSAPCHWHEDIEWIHILKGRMCYYVNGQRLVLNEKDSLMVNARQMHYGSSFEQQDCQFSCILFHPSLFSSHHALLRRYVSPVLEDGSLEYLYFGHGQQLGMEISKFLAQIAKLKETEGYELEAVALMHTLWGRLWQRNVLTRHRERPDMKRKDDLKIQKEMVSFLYQHYSEKITLADIAVSGNVSRSKCCRIFQHFLQQPPIDFLNAYRLKISCSLLSCTSRSITDIALSCGFNHLSYFSKYFYKSYGCTPREYRQRKSGKEK